MLISVIYGCFYKHKSPLFNSLCVKMENGNTLVIEAADNSDKNIYIDEIKLNGNKHGLNFITHSQLQSGGKLNYHMSNTPNKKRGTESISFPFSISRK